MLNEPNDPFLNLGNNYPAIGINEMDSEQFIPAETSLFMKKKEQ